MTIADGPERVVRRWTAGLLLAGLMVAGCTTSGADPADEDGAAGVELAHYDDDRLSFAHPDGWDVEVSDPGHEQRVRVEHHEAGTDHPTAVIQVTWPTIANDDLDAMIRFFGPKADEPEVSELTEHDIEIPGATGAVLLTHRSSEGMVGEDTPTRVWSVWAMSEAGRTVMLTLGVLDGADVEEPDALAEAFLDSIELKPSWD